MDYPTKKQKERGQAVADEAKTAKIM